MAKLTIKILGLSCSYSKGGDTAWLVQYALKSAEEFGGRISEIGDIQTEFLDLAEKEIKPFLDYYQWPKRSNEVPRLRPINIPDDFGCVEQDDYMQFLWAKIAHADGFIFGSPVSVGSASSKFRILCERLTSRVRKGHLTNKPVGLIAVGNSRIGGQESCLRHMAHCISELEMIEVGFLLVLTLPSVLVWGRRVVRELA
jgi:multimeric flavodoxin WrbA